MKTIVYWFVSLALASFLFPGTSVAQQYVEQPVAGQVSDDDEGLMLHGRFKASFNRNADRFCVLDSDADINSELAQCFDS